jgi:hypothetical protein
MFSGDTNEVIGRISVKYCEKEIPEEEIEGMSEDE